MINWIKQLSYSSNCRQEALVKISRISPVPHLLEFVRQPQPLLEPQELRVIMITHDDQLDQKTAIQLMNLVLYIISDFTHRKRRRRQSVASESWLAHLVLNFVNMLNGQVITVTMVRKEGPLRSASNNIIQCLYYFAVMCYKLKCKIWFFRRFCKP